MIGTYLQYSISNDLANRLDNIGLPKTTLERTSNKNLRDKYGLTSDEIKIVKEAIKRQPIEVEVIDKLLENSNFTCCICKGVKGKSYIIHHIIEYSISQNNDYHNLAVLCPNDHDLAHKTGKTLTLKLKEDQIVKAKEKWEKAVRDLNIERASKSGNIFEVDFLNIPRILELSIELFGGTPTTQYSADLFINRLITKDGSINDKGVEQVNKEPITPLIFFAPYGSTTLRFHYYEIFKKILTQLDFIDLDKLLNKTSIKAGLVGQYCYYVGGLYSKGSPETITELSEYLKFSFVRKPFTVEWLVDPKYFCSSSARWRSGRKNVYMIYGKIRSVNIEETDEKAHILIDIRPYCFGLPELQKDRIPAIAYRDQFDYLFAEEE